MWIYRNSGAVPRPRGKLAMRLAMALASMGLLAACSSVERSRSLNDERVAAQTIAQQVCANCHGISGVAHSPKFPNLAGQSPAYFETQMRSFRDHRRFDPVGAEFMWGVSTHLTDEQISGLAKYFSSQVPAVGQTRAPQLEQQGQRIFHQGIADSGVPACAACHGAKGEGMGTFPRLAGQHADYVVKQLNVFQQTEQRPDGAIMKTVAHGLSQDNIKSLAAYVESMAL